MIFASIAMGYKGKLVFIEGKINSEMYLKVLNEANVFTELDAHFGENGYIFMQD